ncbi:UNVERIFIED_CONTAM: 4-hydroxy-tetrahydrodipicolinate synthase, chloroplastic [Sesamum calycinum]|uniref:4-hydroxy-tetrahydrodipicolinate synthase n=1 Tax=Sesamum calycinum TaxID=2727403 RepID=A0AAW2SCZ7_9LAMI
MASALGCCSLKATHRGGAPKWRSPRAAVIPNFHLPMRSYEVKNRTNVDDIKSLRLITAIKTPYLPDGRFDLEAYDALVNMQIEDGVEGVIVGGTTGEGQLMSWDEHIMLIGHTVNCFGGSIKVIGNTGSNSTREAIHATEQGFAVGMHAALHINPYYGKTSKDGLISHFDSVLPMGPTIIYNVPSRTGQDIPPGVIQNIAKSPNLAGVKECVGNDRVEEYTRNGLVVWSGNDDECHDSRWFHGATGVISVASNLVPGLMRELMFGGTNSSLNSKLLPLIDWLFQEPNPIGLNTALAQLGVIRPIFRLPYVPLPLAKRVEFTNIVQELGRENFVGEKDVQVLDDDDFILIGTEVNRVTDDELHLWNFGQYGKSPSAFVELDSMEYDFCPNFLSSFFHNDIHI